MEQTTKKTKKTKKAQCLGDEDAIKLPKPSTKLETYLYIWAKGEGKIPVPATREEMYLAYIASLNGGSGEVPKIPAPVSRREVFYHAIINKKAPDIKAISRYERFLQRIATGENTFIPKPQNLQEEYLKYISEKR